MSLADTEKSAFQLLVVACNRIEADAEVGDTDDGMAVMIPLDLWHQFTDALDHARTQILTEGQWIPEELPASRADWTMGQWAEHFGGRHKDDNPANYYEFGSLMAVSAMLQRFGLVQRQVGWNLCRKTMLDAMTIRIDLEGQ